MTKAESRRRRKSGVERKAAVRPWKFVQHDTPEQINMCLNCAFPDCRGWCAKTAAAKGGYDE